MQSLKGLRFELNEHAKQIRQEMIRRLLQDPDVKRFLYQNQLPADILDRYATKFDGWTKQLNACRVCKGISQCTSSMKGHAEKLQMDENGILITTVVPCKYQKELNSRMEHRSRFRLYHGSSQDLLISLESIAANMNNESGDYYMLYQRALAAAFGTDRGFLVYGPPGTGKTYLLCALANDIAKRGKSISYVRVPLLINELKGCFRDEERRREIMNALRFSEILMLDDFGSESVSAWSRDEVLFPVLDDRMSAKRTTIFASNATPEELARIYSDTGGSSQVASLRLMERVNTLADPVNLNGKSRRH